MTINFNHDWTFCKEGEKPVAVCLPHDAMITEQRTEKCQNGVNSGYFPGGKYIYEKIFDLTDEQSKKFVTIHFGGVYRNCSILINGCPVGNHVYGYTSFSIDISDYVRQGSNKITVFVDNSLEPNCRWYTGSGIYRPVRMEIREKVHIKSVRVETLNYSSGRIRVSAESSLPCTVEIYDGVNLVFSGECGEIQIADAKLWNAENPHLYTCIIKTETDEVKSFFGIRKIELNPKKGFLVNGERVLLRGGCVHQDHGILGACEYYEAEERRIKILKAMGFNALRVSHNPASEELLNICDKIGMYVINEAFDGWYIPKNYHDYSRSFDSLWQADLRAAIESSVNHPCVIMYSLGNEVTETAEEKGIRLCAQMRDYVKSVDDTRPVTCGVNILLDFYSKMGIGVYRDKGEYKPEPLTSDNKYRNKKTGSAFFNAMTNKLNRLFFLMSKLPLSGRLAENISGSMDILGLNYASSRYDPDIKKYPDRMMLGTETMVSELPYNWERVKKYPQLVGDFVWSAWDYLGEACIGDWTYHSYKGLPLLAGQGMIDITGKPLASMYYMQIVWGLRKQPFIAVRPVNHAKETPSTGAWQFTNAIDSWSWQGFEKTEATVEVFADAAFVRLILNGVAVGTKPVKKFRTKFRTKYFPGVLTAEALDKNGNVISKHSLESGKKETILNAVPEKSIISKEELCYIAVEFTDVDGVLKPFVEQRVEINVKGPAKLIGFGSALCKTDEVFNKNYHNSYRGRCIAAIKSDNVSGDVLIEVKSAGVQTVNAKIKVK